MNQHCFRFSIAALAGFALMLAACGGAATAEPTTATEPTPVATATPPASPTGAVEVAEGAVRVLEHIEQLASEIGIRNAGSEGERAAAAYIEGELMAAGYETSIEPFTATTRRDISLATTASGVSVRPFMMNGSASGKATGLLVLGGLGTPAELAGLELEGAVLLLNRGVLTFEEKAQNAEAAGAVALLIANNEDGVYSGSLGGLQAGIPVVAIRSDEGELLRPLAEQSVDLTVRAGIEQVTVESQNVVARAGEVCEVYLGAHYDSVEAGPGANDNASGVSLLLEIARVQRADGVCAVAFGAEEIGLFGSREFVETHDVGGAEWMLNFDMVGRLNGPIVVGDDRLTREIIAALAAAGEFPIVAGAFPPFASSDHVSFSEAGIPAVTISSGDDAAIHTSDDRVERISTEALALMLEIVDVMLEGVALRN